MIKNINDVTLSPAFIHILKDACSYVSLRDVERAMIVFDFFKERMHLFEDFITVKARAEVSKYYYDAWSLTKQ